MKKVIIIIIALLLIGLIVYKVQSSSAPTYKTETVKLGTIVKTISASGKVDSEETVELKFQTSGLLSWVGVKEGDRVSQWQAIASLDTRELQKTLEKSLRDYGKERNDFEETRRVDYPYYEPKNALNDTVKRILEKNQWDLEKAVLDVELKDIALKLATLITPISGIVTSIDTPIAGVNITPASAVFSVANPQKMIFKANIDEADIANIKKGLKTKIMLDAYPDKIFEGNVAKVGFAAVSTAGGGTAFPVEISLPKNDNLQFKMGLSGDVDIEIERKIDTLLISSRAIFDQAVEKIVNGKPQKIKVKTGLSSGSKTEILSGLQKGDKIVVK